MSRNIQRQFGLTLSKILNIPLATVLGKYLGTPSNPTRVSKKTYAATLERVQQKLQGWKVRTFSLATRATLIRSVILATPPYAMQTSSPLKEFAKKLINVKEVFSRVVLKNIDGCIK